MAKLGLNLTAKDRKQLDLEIQRNRKERLKFIDQYADWLKRTPNSVWSAQYAKFFGKTAPLKSSAPIKHKK